MSDARPPFSRLPASIISTGALGAYVYGIGRYGQGARAGALAFQALVFGQLLHAFSCRSEHHRLLGKRRPPTNPCLNAAVGGSLVLQVLTMCIPGLRGFLGLTPPAVMDAAVIGATALLPFLANESRKLVQSNPAKEVTT
jgi:Ca2+-transporting ATPase